MTIQHATYVIPFASRIGGYERQGLRVADALADRGIAVSILTHADHARKLEAMRRGSAERGLSPGVRIYGLRMGRFPSRDALIDRFLCETDIVHIHALDPMAGRVATRCVRLGIPFLVKVATSGDIEKFAEPVNHVVSAPPEVEARGHQSRWIARQVIELGKAWRSLSQADRFIALNHEIADELRRFGVHSERIRQCPNGVTIPSRSAPFRPGGRSCVYVGRIESRKRVDLLLEAFAQVRRRVPEATLAIIGRDDEAADLKSAYPQTNVTWLGEHDSPRTWLAEHADLFVFASEREGCPNALLEAASIGIACVAFDIAGVRDWFEDDVNIILAPRTAVPVDDLTQAWTTALIDDDRRRRIARTAREHVRQTASLETVIDMFMDMYDELRRGERPLERTKKNVPKGI